MMVVVMLVLCMLLILVQRWPNEQSKVAPTIIAAVAPTLRQRLVYGCLIVIVLAGKVNHINAQT